MCAVRDVNASLNAITRDYTREQKPVLVMKITAADDDDANATATTAPDVERRKSSREES